MIDLSFFKSIRDLTTQIVREHDSFKRYLKLKIADIVPKDVINILTIDSDGKCRDIYIEIPPVKVCSISYNEKMEKITHCIMAHRACLYTRKKLVALRFDGDGEEDESSVIIVFRVSETFKAYKFMYYILDIKQNRDAILLALETLMTHPNVVNDDSVQLIIEKIRKIVELITML